MPHQASTGHIDVALTNFSLRQKSEGMVGDIVSPRVKVNKQTDKIRVYDTTHMKSHLTLIGQGGKAQAKKMEWGLSTDDSYLAEGYALKDIVTDKEMSNYDKPLDAKKDTVQALTEAMNLDREIRLAAQLLSTSVLTNNTTLSGTSQWSDYVNGISDPLTDIKTGVDSVRDNGGKRPNFILMDYKTALTLANHPDIIDLLKNHQKLEFTDLLGFLPNVFGLQPIVAESMKDTAALAVATSLSPVWGADVLIGYRDMTPSIKSWTLCFTFDWKPGRMVIKQRDWDPRGEWQKVEENGLDEKVFTANLGYLIKAAIA